MSKKDLLKVFILFGIAFGLAELARAAEQVRDTIGVSRVSWSERMSFIQGTNINSGWASYTGNALSWDRSWASGRTGFGIGAFLAQGRGSTGDFDGTTTFATDMGSRGFTLLGLAPRYFYRLNPNVQMGASAELIYRKVDWAADDTSITVRARPSMGFGGGFDLRVLLTPNWEFSQKFSLMSMQAETFWLVGIHYKY